MRAGAGGGVEGEEASWALTVRMRQPLRCAQLTSDTTSATVRGAQVRAFVRVGGAGSPALGAAAVRGSVRGFGSVDSSTLRSVRALDDVMTAYGAGFHPIG